MASFAPKLQQQIDFYAEYHQHDTNELIHKICVPIIAATTLMFFAWFPMVIEAPGLVGAVRPSLPLLGEITLAHFAFLGAMAYYLYLDKKMGATMAVYYLAIPLGNIFHWELTIALFVLAWIGQFIGHGVYEKRSPAFTTTPNQLLIGPIYVMALFFGHDFSKKPATTDQNGASERSVEEKTESVS